MSPVSQLATPAEARRVDVGAAAQRTAPGAAWLAPLAVSGFVMAGFFKGSPALAALPFDLTAALAGITLALVALRLARSVPQGLLQVTVVFALLAVPVAWTRAGGYGDDKMLRLFTLTFLSIVAPVVLIDSVRQAGRFLAAWVGACGLVVVGALVAPRAVSSYAGASIASEATNTIEVGRAAGLVMVAVALGLIWRRVPFLVGLPCIGIAAYVGLRSGSRGPLLSTGIAVIASLLLARARPRRLRSLTVLALCGLLLTNLYAFAPFYARARISTVLHGQVVGDNATRVDLYRVAAHSVDVHPWGIGWGGFERVAFTGYRYPHDLPLEVLCEAGLLVGGLFLLWLLGSIVLARKAAKGFAGALTFSIVVFMFLNSLVSGDLNDNRTLFFALGIALALRRQTRLATSGSDHIAGRPEVTQR